MFALLTASASALLSGVITADWRIAAGTAIGSLIAQLVNPLTVAKAAREAAQLAIETHEAKCALLATPTKRKVEL